MTEHTEGIEDASADLPDQLTGLFEEIARLQAQPWPRRFVREVWRQIRVEVRHWPYRGRRGVVHLWQRATRSWDARSVWDLDHWLGSVIGAQLIYMADIAHGSPMGYPGDFEGWVADLRANGEILKRHGEDRLDDILNDRDRDVYLAAQKSMHWVADNFGALWD